MKANLFWIITSILTMLMLCGNVFYNIGYEKGNQSALRSSTQKNWQLKNDLLELEITKLEIELSK